MTAIPVQSNHCQGLKFNRGQVQVLSAYEEEALKIYVQDLWKKRPDISCPRWKDESFLEHAEFFKKIGQIAFSDFVFQDLLVCLGVIFRSTESPCSQSVALNHSAARGLNVVFQALDSRDPVLLSFMPLLLSAFKLSGLQFASEYQRAQARHIANTLVKASIDAGSRDYVRSDKYDIALIALFPDLRSALVRGAPGTIEYSIKISKSSPEYRHFNRCSAEFQDDAFFRACLSAAESVGIYGRRWSRGSDVDFDKWTRYSDVCKLSNSDYRFVKAAYDARRNSIEFPDFILDLGIDDPADLDHFIVILTSIYMLA